MTVTLYGIANCDTVKKARAWLDDRGIDHRFHDYKKAGVPEELLPQWVAAEGWETILNRAGTTFKKLPEADKEGIDAAKAMALMLAQPSMIKRPIVMHPGGLLIGFRPEYWAAALAG